MNAIGRAQREPTQGPYFHAREGSTPLLAKSIDAPATRTETTIERRAGGPLESALEPEAPPPPVAVKRLAERDRLLFSLSNDNFFSMLGMPPKSGFGAGDDFGPTHGLQI